ncbi:MAG: FtsK/SpoIIIE domain-containing protein [bacterium]
MRFLKRSNIVTFPNSLLGQDNLLEALQKDTSSSLSFPVGKDGDGKYVYTDFQKYAYIIAAGETDSGISAFRDTMLVSLMYKNTPNELKFILIGSKRESLLKYQNSPYLRFPVTTGAKEFKNTLSWLKQEVIRRFDILTEANLRNVYQYNSKHKKKINTILVVIDEIAELALIHDTFLEETFIWLMQRSVAVGINCLISTDHISDKNFSGMILANSFVRIAFRLPTKKESESLIFESGAENLKGNGDLLFSTLALPAVRLQAPYISDESLMRVIEYTSKNRL